MTVIAKVRRIISAECRGQALIESAIAIAVLAIVLCGMANLAYLVYTQAAISSASRQAAMFAASGTYSPLSEPLPALSGTCAVAANEVQGWLSIPGTSWGATAASTALNGTGWANTASCASSQYTMTPAYPPQGDPEAAAGNFTMTAVSTNVVIAWPINATILGVSPIALPSASYGQTVYFRQVN